MAKPASGTGLDTGGAYYSYLTNAKGAVYGMLEGSGSTSADSSGNGRTLTLDTTAVTGVTWSTNGGGEAILVCGGSTTSGLTMGSGITFASASQFSVAFRANVSITAVLYGLFGNNTAANYFLADDANFGDYGSVSGNSFIFTGSGATDWRTDADWFLTVDGVGLKVHLFHNGTEVGDSPKTITAGDASWAMTVLAGGYASGSLTLVGTMTYLYVLPGLVGTATDAGYFHSTPYGIFSAGGGGDVTVALIGSAITAAPGTLGVSRSQALSGLAGAFAAGVVAPGSALALSGAAVIAASGTLAPSFTSALTGVSATTATGALTPATTIGLTGLAVTLTTGIITVPGDVTVSLTGLSMSASGGALGVAIARGLTGQSATFTTGSVSPAFAITLTGSAAIFFAGTIAASGGDLPSSGGTVCGTVSVSPRVGGTVGLTPRVGGVVGLGRC